MKNRTILGCILLFLVGLAGLGAQQHPPEVGMALRYENTGERLFVTHRTFPFGTRLRVTNLLNNAELELTVDGTPIDNPRVMIGVSSLASDFLGIPSRVLNQVQIEVLSVPPAAPAMRPRLGAITQTGNAVVVGNATTLTASHPSIPIGRTAVLTNTSNNRRATVTINGRCPAARDRIIEISPAVARALDIRNSGQVRLESSN